MIANYDSKCQRNIKITSRRGKSINLFKITTTSVTQSVQNLPSLFKQLYLDKYYYAKYEPKHTRTEELLDCAIIDILHFFDRLFQTSATGLKINILPNSFQLDTGYKSCTNCPGRLLKFVAQCQDSSNNTIVVENLVSLYTRSNGKNMVLCDNFRMKVTDVICGPDIAKPIANLIKDIIFGHESPLSFSCRYYEAPYVQVTITDKINLPMGFTLTMTSFSDYLSQLLFGLGFNDFMKQISQLSETTDHVKLVDFYHFILDTFAQYATRLYLFNILRDKQTIKILEIINSDKIKSILLPAVNSFPDGNVTPHQMDTLIRPPVRCIGTRYASISQISQRPYYINNYMIFK